jgi:hypothetical protein
VSLESQTKLEELQGKLYTKAKEGSNRWQAVFIPASAHPDRVGDWRVRLRARMSSLSDADFAQEYPENDLEAIQTTGRPVFRHEDILRQPSRRQAAAGWSTANGRPRHHRRRRAKASIWTFASASWTATRQRINWTGRGCLSRLDRLRRRCTPRAAAGHRGRRRNNHGHAVLLRLAQLHAGTAPYRIFRAKDRHLGWLTTTATRPLLVDQLEEALRTAGISLHDGGSIDQFGAFAYSDDGRPEAQEGYHDDDVLAAGIAWQVRRRSFRRVLDVRHSEERARPARLATA